MAAQNRHPDGLRRTRFATMGSCRLRGRGFFSSGVLYQDGSLLACLAGSAVFLAITAIAVARLPKTET